MLTQNSVVEGAQIPGIMKLEYWAPRANVRTGWCPVGGAHGAWWARASSRQRTSRRGGAR